MKRIVLVLLVFVAVLFLAKNLVAQVVVSQTVRAVTGLPVQIHSMEVGVFRPIVSAKGVKLFNPFGYPDRTMIDLPELFIQYDPGAFFRGTIHLNNMKIHLNELVVVKNQAGELNLHSIRGVRAASQKQKTQPPVSEKKPPTVQIDLLELKISTVLYKDYSAGTPPKVREFHIGIDERYQNVTNTAALGTLIVTRALMKTTIASLANLDLGALQSELGSQILPGVRALTGSATGVAEGAVQAAGETVKQATETLQQLLPFEKKNP